MPPTTMNAVRLYGQRDVRLDSIPVPSPGPGQVKCAPKFCGICGSDLHEYLGGPKIIPAKGHPHHVTGEEAPVVLGHEFSAVVEEVGSGVDNVKPGDRVCIEPTLYDGSCAGCKAGYPQCCKNVVFLGLHGGGGGLSDHIVVPASCVKLLPDNVPLDIGALVEPLAVGWHAVSISPFRPEYTVLVLGGGPIGLALIQALRSRGCNKIIVSEVSRNRKVMAEDFGAHHTVNPVTSDAKQEIMNLTDGAGVDIAFDAAGVQAAADMAFEVLKVGATLVNVAVWEQRATVDLTQMLLSEKKYMGSMGYSKGDFEDVIQAISSGTLDPRRMITKVIKLDQVDSEGFNTLANDRENHVKILVDVGAEIQSVAQT